MLVNTLSKVWLKPLLVLPFLVLTACGSEDATKTTQNTFLVTAGDGRATVTWSEDSKVSYRVYSARAGQITPANYTTFPEAKIVYNAHSGDVISGLTNGQTYSFTINASTGGPYGEAAVSQAIVPRPAGDSWFAGKPAGTRNLNALVNGNGTMVAAGDGGVLYTSANAGTWGTWDSGNSKDVRGLLYDGARLVAVGDEGTALISTDLVAGTPTWKATVTGVPNRLNSVAYSGTTYVAVGTNGMLLSGVAGTDKTIVWTQQNSGATVNLNKVAFLNNQFVALGNGGFILTSPDAITWTVQNSTVRTVLNDIAQVTLNGANTYVVVGNGGTILRSADLITWTADAITTPANLNTVAVGSRVMIGGDSGTILYGNGNGAWTLKSTGNSSDVKALANTSSGGYVAVGALGSNAYAY
ncbi:hypothetical protein [Chitinimonas sp. BJB300]|uniref:hypothetical protein n=1 Tax=Chitinimonas sp. BJB300 TaxID=1559339 RepID=UPI000C120485|nr:hypothetical protein [Chitinimonas sp. BJB300]PHV11950.1 hypothetical protein CSQ89_08155 [Chitinimonas sp. BJB300]TSJ87286.1 hypothetical protein FG002_015005 [Chitinimonas sp. BJB300]